MGYIAHMRTIIIGGVAAGMSAATRLRRLDEQREIIVFERGEYVSFANCGLPYYIGGVVPERSALLLQTPGTLRARFDLDVRVLHEVTSIDPIAHTVTVTSLRTGDVYVEHYDELVLAAGAESSPGLDLGDVPTRDLRTIPDVDAIMATLGQLETPSDLHAVVVGAGFIGLEAAENLRRRGAHVTLIQRSAQIFAPLDSEMTAPILRELRDAGIGVRTRTTVAKGARGHVELSDGSMIRADLVVTAGGVRPATSLARGAGLRLGPTGGIEVDAHQRTSDPSVWAVGDGVEKIDHVSGEATLVTMAGLANRHGRAAADDIAAHRAHPAAPALGTAIIGVFGATAASIGWNERRLRASGRAHRVIHSHPMSHAGYYPGAQQMSMKLLVDPTSDKILGAQIVGRDGVDKRMDVISVAMSAGITASGLSRLELSYAPQYGSAKDPINLLGYIAENHATGTAVSVQWHELSEALAAGAHLVDVRSHDEYAAGAIPGAVNIPLDELRARHTELPDRPIIVHCQVGQRGHTAARLLSQLGYEVRNLDGGWLTWSHGTESAPEADTTPRRAS